MKYYRITCYTPFWGEEIDYYIATDSRKDLERFARDCVCHIEEIDEEEFKKHIGKEW